MKKRYTEYSGRLLKVNLTPEIREKIVAACWDPDSGDQNDIGKIYGISGSWVSYLKRKYERENLYGQHTGGRGK